MKRASFLVDGFNLYHSLKAAQRVLDGTSTKWLDIRSLCRSYLYLFGKDARLTHVFYFTALASHLGDPRKVARHQKYIECIKSTGVHICLSRFKKKSIHCDKCNSWLLRHEEKETDVAMAVKVLELFHTNQSDIVVLVTGDTDLAPAARTVDRLFPNATIAFAFPYGRMNAELRNLAPASFKIHKRHYAKHQLSDPVVIPNKSPIHKPATW